MRKLITLLILSFVLSVFCACNDTSKGDISDIDEDSALENDTENQTAGTESPKYHACFWPPEIYTPAEFEERLREDISLRQYCIPYQKILSFGELEHVEIDPAGDLCDYFIVDEYNNSWYVTTMYAPEGNFAMHVRRYWPTGWRGNKELLTQKILPAGGLPENIYTVDGLEGFYVDDLDNPTIEYFYQKSVLHGIRFVADHMEIYITDDFSKEPAANSTDSDLMVNNLPRMFTSYSELQTAIENIRENVAEYTAQFEATE